MLVPADPLNQSTNQIPLTVAEEVPMIETFVKLLVQKGIL